jgi:hypothetical protein
LRLYLNTLRGLAWAAICCGLAIGGLTIAVTKPAHAEFEIQETTIEKGEVEVEYRGAVHWGVPGTAISDEAAGDALEEVIEPGLRQSHDLEVQWSATDWLQVSITNSFTEPLDNDLNLTSVEGETLFELIEREGNGLGLAFDLEYEQAINHGDEEEANEFAFGPFVELAQGPLLLTLNPLFTHQTGDNAETAGLGFDYGWRAEYKVATHWGVGVEMFGEIEDLPNSGSFNDQTHSIGPTLFYNPGGEDDDVGGEGDDDELAGPPPMEFSLNVGVQFGLTDATSDTALKFQGAIGF